MGYQEALYAARKARLRRMGAAAVASQPNSKQEPSRAGATTGSKVQPIAEPEDEITRVPTESVPPSDGRVLGRQAPKRPTIETIKAIVAEAYGIATADLRKGRREIKYLTPRMVAMHLARRHTAWTLAEIAGHFGKRGHAPARYANRWILRRRELDSAFDAELCELECRLRDAAEQVRYAPSRAIRKEVSR
jgi:hypothetical protein